MKKIYNDDSYLGYEGISNKINVRNELSKFKKNPLDEYLNRVILDKYHNVINIDNKLIFQTEIDKYYEAYNFFYLSLERYLSEMSIAVRYENSLSWKKKTGQKFTENEKKLAKKFNSIKRYVEYDLYNCLIFSRVLSDRIICLSRFFLKGEKLPSFTSFNAHKKFFKALREKNRQFDENEEYINKILNETDWFDLLKLVRDKHLIHGNAKHLKLLTLPNARYEMGLSILTTGVGKEGVKMRLISVSIPQLADDIYDFLIWYSKYAIKRLNLKK